MTDLEALLVSILSHPDDDTPRLLYADMLEEIGGQEERAAFIRTQVELARCEGEADPSCGRNFRKHYVAHGMKRVSCPDCWKELRRRELELWHQLPTCKTFSPWASSITTDPTRTRFCLSNVDGMVLNVSRGFISSLTCSWSDWLSHHERLYFHPTQEVECPTCREVSEMDHRIYGTSQRVTCLKCGSKEECYKATGRILRPLMVKVRCEKCLVVAGHRWCDDCHGHGTIERSLLDAAQPITRVRLTTRPAWHNTDDMANRATWFTTHDGYRFDRVKCWKCKGVGAYYDICDQCHGQPLNDWTCPAWPTIRFTMPEAQRDSLGRIAREMAAPPSVIGSRRVVFGSS